MPVETVPQLILLTTVLLHSVLVFSTTTYVFVSGNLSSAQGSLLFLILHVYVGIMEEDLLSSDDWYYLCLNVHSGPSL